MSYPVMAWNVEFIRFQSSTRMVAAKMVGLWILGLNCEIATNWSPLGNGSGRSRMASMAENTALFAPMASAKVRITATEKEGDLRMKRNADFRLAAVLSTILTR